MKHPSVKKTISSALCAVLLATQSLFAHLPEVSVWEGRRQAHSMLTAAPVAAAPRPVAKPGRPTLFLMQDVHANLEAQRDISRVLSDLLTHRGATVVALEGAFGPLPVAPFRSPTHTAAVRLVSDALLNDGRISGAAHAGLTVNRGSFIGIDDAPHYDANVDAYLASVPQRSRARMLLKTLADHQDREQDRIFSPTLRNFEKARNAHSRNELPLSDYLTRLRSAAPRDAAPAIDVFLRAHELETSLRNDAIESERADVIRALSRRLSSPAYARLLAQATKFRDGGLTHGVFYAELKALCSKSGVDLSGKSALNAYLRYVELSESIDGKALFNEVRGLEKAATRHLAVTPDQRALCAAIELRRLSEKLVEFSLTRQEWTLYTQFPPARRPLPPRLRAPFEAFYNEALMRDSRLAGNALAAMEGADTGVVVVGGFHADALTHTFRAAGWDVVTLHPRLTKLDLNGASAYLSAFSQEHTPLDRLLQGERLFLSQAPLSPDVMAAELAGGVIAAEHLGKGRRDQTAVYEGLIPFVPVNRVTAEENDRGTAATIEHKVGETVLTLQIVDGRTILHREDRGLRLARRLKKLPAQAVDALRSLLSDPDPEVRLRAARSLRKAEWTPRSDEERARFFLALQDWKQLATIKESAVRVLKNVLTATEPLSDKEHRIVARSERAAVLVLAALLIAAPLPILPFVNLGVFFLYAALPLLILLFLISALEWDTDDAVRYVRLAKKAFRQRVWEARHNAVRLLADIGGPDALWPLLAATGSGNPGLARHASEALRRVLIDQLRAPNHEKIRPLMGIDVNWRALVRLENGRIILDMRKFFNPHARSEGLSVGVLGLSAIPILNSIVSDPDLGTIAKEQRNGLFAAMAIAAAAEDLSRRDAPESRAMTQSRLAYAFGPNHPALNWSVRIALSTGIVIHELFHFFFHGGQKPYGTSVRMRHFFSGMPWETRGWPALAGIAGNLATAGALGLLWFFHLGAFGFESWIPGVMTLVLVSNILVAVAEVLLLPVAWWTGTLRFADLYQFQLTPRARPLTTLFHWQRRAWPGASVVLVTSASEIPWAAHHAATDWVAHDLSHHHDADDKDPHAAIDWIRSFGRLHDYVCESRYSHLWLFEHAVDPVTPLTAEERAVLFSHLLEWVRTLPDSGNNGHGPWSPAAFKEVIRLLTGLAAIGTANLLEAKRRNRPVDDQLAFVQAFFQLLTQDEERFSFYLGHSSAFFRAELRQLYQNHRELRDAQKVLYSLIGNPLENEPPHEDSADLASLAVLKEVHQKDLTDILDPEIGRPEKYDAWATPLDQIVEKAVARGTLSVHNIPFLNESLPDATAFNLELMGILSGEHGFDNLVLGHMQPLLEAILIPLERTTPSMTGPALLEIVESHLNSGLNLSLRYRLGLDRVELNDAPRKALAFLDEIHALKRHNNHLRVVLIADESRNSADIRRAEQLIANPGTRRMLFGVNGLFLKGAIKVKQIPLAPMSWTRAGANYAALLQAAVGDLLIDRRRTPGPNHSVGFDAQTLTDIRNFVRKRGLFEGLKVAPDVLPFFMNELETSFLMMTAVNDPRPDDDDGDQASNDPAPRAPDAGRSDDFHPNEPSGLLNTTPVNRVFTDSMLTALAATPLSRNIDTLDVRITALAALVPDDGSKASRLPAELTALKGRPAAQVRTILQRTLTTHLSPAPLETPSHAVGLIRRNLPTAEEERIMDELTALGRRGARLTLMVEEQARAAVLVKEFPHLNVRWTPVVSRRDGTTTSILMKNLVEAMERAGLSDAARLCLVVSDQDSLDFNDTRDLPWLARMIVEIIGASGKAAGRAQSLRMLDLVARRISSQA